jgi:hypothetical protein
MVIKLKLSVNVSGLAGTVVLNIPPHPSDKLQYIPRIYYHHLSVPHTQQVSSGCVIPIRILDYSYISQL